MFRRLDSGCPGHSSRVRRDILDDVSRDRRRRPTVVGIAADTVNAFEHAGAKPKRQKFDLIAANDVSRPGAAFAAQHQPRKDFGEAFRAAARACFSAFEARRIGRG